MRRYSNTLKIDSAGFQPRNVDHGQVWTNKKTFHFLKTLRLKMQKQHVNVKTDEFISFLLKVLLLTVKIPRCFTM